MFNLRIWAIGVAAVPVLATAQQVGYVRLMPPGCRQRRWKGEAWQSPDDVQAQLAELMR